MTMKRGDKAIVLV